MVEQTKFLLVLLQQTITVGCGFTAAVPANTILAGAGSTSVLDGHIQGVITEVGSGQVSIKVTEHVARFRN